MVDEMDLLSGLKAAEPVRPDAFEEARATLRAAMVVEDAVPEPASVRARRPRWGRECPVCLECLAGRWRLQVRRFPAVQPALECLARPADPWRRLLRPAPARRP